MPNKYIPSAEQLEQIKLLYAITNNYSEVSRQTNINASVIKRILEDNKDKGMEEKKEKIKELIYCGLPPIEPDIPLEFSFNTIIENFYQEVLKKDGVL